MIAKIDGRGGARPRRRLRFGVGLRTRLGDLSGVRLAEDGASRTTIAHALELGRRTPSLFIEDGAGVAMITASDQPPLLCSRFGRLS